MLGRIYGSARKSIDDLRFSPNPTALRFLQVYDSLPKNDRERVPLEAICIKAEVSPQEYLGMVFLMRQSLGKAESSLLAVSAFPNVVQDMVKFAAEPAGYADRKMLAQHPAIGFLPNPKGASLSVNLFGGEASFEEKDADPEFDGFTEAFSGKNELEEWSKNKEILLGDGK
jgi:hypothetical protein